MSERVAPRWAGALPLAVWALNALDKIHRGVAFELLWSCHMFALAAGVLVRWRPLVEVDVFYFVSTAISGLPHQRVGERDDQARLTHRITSWRGR